MADRFWVGGSGTWNSSNTANWSATSGGAGGASVPTSVDDVYFNAASGTVTCTVSSAICRNITFAGFTGTLAGSGSFSIFGSLTASAGMTWTNTSLLGFSAASGSFSVTTAGKTVGACAFGTSIATATWTLGGALTSSGAITLTGGTFTTNNYNVTASSLQSSNSNTRAINMGSSTVTLSASGTVLSFSTATGLTFNAGTSSIVLSSAAAPSINTGGQTFYDLSFTGVNATSFQVIGANTFRNLTIAGRTSAGVTQLLFNNDQTINGTLTLSAGSNATMRTFVRSNAIGTTRTISAAFADLGSTTDFRDITLAGGAAGAGGSGLGDCKGNSGITFPAPKTVYWSIIGNGSWASGAWATTSNGLGSTANFPLAQDTAIFDNNSGASGMTATVNAGYNIGTINMSTRTSNTMTLATGTQTPTIYGNWINGTGTTLTGTGTLTFAGRGSQTITSAGRTFTQAFSVSSPGGSVTLQDALTTSNSLSASPLNLTGGTLDMNGYNLTQSGNAPGGISLSANPGDAFLVMGAGNLTIAGQGTGAFNNPLGCSVTGTGTISLTSASAKSFRGGNIQTYPTLNQGGTGTLTVTGSNKFANITNTAIGSVLFTGGTTNDFDNFNLNGTSTAARLTLGSTNTTQAILRKPTAWNVGTGSLDGGNNTGLSFISGNNNFLNISYINAQLIIVTSDIFYGNTNISSIYYGNTPVVALYYGSVKVF